MMIHLINPLFRRAMIIALAISVCLFGSLGWQIALSQETKPSTDLKLLIDGDRSRDNEAGGVEFSAKFEMEQNSNRGLVSVTAVIAEGWHMFSTTQPKGGPMKTRIAVKSAALANPAAEFLFQPNQPPKTHIDDAAWKGLLIEEHEGTVTWTAPLELTAGTKPEDVTLEISVRGQRCRSSCVPINETLVAEFSGYYNAAKMETPPAKVNAIPPAVEKKAATTVPKAEVVTNGAERLPFWQAILFGAIGGFILNFMPCVLPVIGLKIIAFAEQAGNSRARVLALNLTYCAGLMLVFLILATLAAFFDFGWSKFFQNSTFRYIILGVVFVMGLSFLGVWEIPIPGFVGSGKANKLQRQEGLSGAFFKGIFTTIMATPCSGPFLGGVFFYTVTAPWYETYLIFTSIGLGMSLPYLLIGMEPSLIRWLPKPGEWMETFKQILGFVMLAAAIYFFHSVNLPGNTLALLTMLFGLSVGCWWIGKVPNYAEMKEHVLGWTTATLMAALISFGGFHFLDSSRRTNAQPNGETIVKEGHNLLFDWQPYSPEALEKARNEGKTVMIEFTASWCLNCIVNMNTAINTPEVKQVVKENNVVALIADWTDGDPLVTKKLEELGSITIPFLAVYSGEKPEKVFVLPDQITKGQLLETLRKAGPSKVQGTAQNGKQERASGVAKADQ